ncbi:MAG: hypothetical protein AB7O59_03400 [Pirellulales bacterium]
MRTVIGLCLVSAALLWAWAEGERVALAQQQPAPRATAQPAQRAAAPPSAKAAATPATGVHPAAAVDDAARKSEILSSQRWRRAMFELNEWLGSQRIYTPEQVARIKADFSAKVKRLSAEELGFMLDDMDAKFKVLETPQAQDARAWVAQYLSILSDKKRAEVVGKMPNLATMTAPQLEQQIAAIEGRRAAAQQQQAQVQQLRDSAPNPWAQNTKLAEEAYIRDHSVQTGGYSSPYRSPSFERPFENVKTGPDMGMYVSPYGGVGLILGGF